MMIKPYSYLLIMHLLILLLSGFVVIKTANASSIVGYDAKIPVIPDLREDGSPLDKSSIKAFRLFKVGEEGLEPLTPDILYNQENEVSGTVFVSVETAEGTIDLCAMTIDTFDRISTICSDVVSMPFKVAPPAAPGGVTFTQTFSITIGN